jgi:hypothetical protein
MLNEHCAVKFTDTRSLPIPAGADMFWELETFMGGLFKNLLRLTERAGNAANRREFEASSLL